MKITLEMLGVDMTRKQVDKLKKKPTAKKVWNTISWILHSEVLRNFAKECAPDGSPWKPLAALTIQLRTKGKNKSADRRPRILQDSGRLRGSIAARHGEGWAEVGTTLSYAPTHQYGDPSRRIPARSFVGLTPVIVDRVRATMYQWMEQDL